ncbi:hypothetical protein HO173_008381 [Letharia columbiana]|uniref:Uncharacterized protein n=1 Tax=Letharia columbiana TaxID=112416 RepID=A0A8H6FRT9_9LECA|nr:uncharacterized protein HO173_008381 [Letharia columbiana]KAF6233449.1 hypothetical protein HO173_008381 [Letharia columbiana]
MFLDAADNRREWHRTLDVRLMARSSNYQCTTYSNSDPQGFGPITRKEGFRQPQEGMMAISDPAIWRAWQRRADAWWLEPERRLPLSGPGQNLSSQQLERRKEVATRASYSISCHSDATVCQLHDEYNFASDRDKKALSEALQFFCSEATIQDLNPSNAQLLREQQALNDKVASHEQSLSFKAQLHRCGVLKVRATSCFDFGQCVGRAEENRRSSQGLTE